MFLLGLCFGAEDDHRAGGATGRHHDGRTRSSFLADPTLLVPAPVPPIRGRKTPGRRFTADLTGRFCSEVNTRLMMCAGDPYAPPTGFEEQLLIRHDSSETAGMCVLHLTSLLYASCGL